MSTLRRRVRPLVVCGLLLAACEPDPSAAKQAFPVRLEVTSDDGARLGGACLDVADGRLGCTDEHGVLQASVYGSEGDREPLRIQCPKGHTAPEKLPELRLTSTRRLGTEGEAKQSLRVEVVCARDLRQVAIVVNAESGPDLPVVIDGARATITDDEGNAHVLLKVPRDTPKVEVGIDTSERPDLKPRDPSRVFELDGRDAVLVMEQRFTQQKMSRPSRRVAARARHIPYRLE